MANKLFDNSIQAHVSNNTSLRDDHIVIDLNVGGSQRTRFTANYTGNLSLQLATAIADQLWFKTLCYTNIRSTSRQSAYELARCGIIPLSLTIPGSLPDIEFYGESYVSAIADGVLTFVCNTLRRYNRPQSHENPDSDYINNLLEVKRFDRIGS